MAEYSKEKQRRIDLGNLLKQTANTTHGYFDPPPSKRLEYPCIVYELDDVDVEHADDIRYSHHKKYSFTYITTDADVDIINSFLLLKYCKFVSKYASDNLWHYKFYIYY